MLKLKLEIEAMTNEQLTNWAVSFGNNMKSGHYKHPGSGVAQSGDGGIVWSITGEDDSQKTVDEGWGNGES